MARAGISEYRIHKACETLLTQGIEPTVRKLREHLGGGSTTRIAEVLKAWRARQPQAPDNPDAGADRLQVHVAAIYDQMLEDLESRLHEHRSQVQQLVESSADQLADAQSLIEELRDQLQVAEGERSQLQADNQAKATEIADMKTEMAWLRGQTVELDRVRQELDRSRNQVEKAQAALSESEQLLKAEQDKCAEESKYRLLAEAAMQRQQIENDRLRQQQEELKRDLSRFKEQDAQLRMVCDQTQVQSQKLAESLQNATSQAAEHKACAGKLQAFLDEARTHAAHQAERENQLRRQQKESSEHNRQLEQRLLDFVTNEQASSAEFARIVTERDQLRRELEKIRSRKGGTNREY